MQGRAITGLILSGPPRHRGYAFQSPNLVHTAQALRIGGEDLTRRLKRWKAPASAQESLKETLVVRRDDDHKISRRAAGLFLGCNAGEKIIQKAPLACNLFRTALADVFAHLRIAEFEVILQFLGAHGADDRNTVLFHDEILLVEPHALGHLSEVHACLGAGDAKNGFAVTRRPLGGGQCTC